MQKGVGFLSSSCIMKQNSLCSGPALNLTKAGRRVEPCSHTGQVARVPPATSQCNGLLCGLTPQCHGRKNRGTKCVPVLGSLLCPPSFLSAAMLSTCTKDAATGKVPTTPYPAPANSSFPGSGSSSVPPLRAPSIFSINTLTHHRPLPFRTTCPQEAGALSQLPFIFSDPFP